MIGRAGAGSAAPCEIWSDNNPKDQPVSKSLASLGLAVMALAVAGQALALAPGPQPQHNVSIIRHHHRARYRNGVEVHAFNYPVTAPLDSASGHTSGKRQHKPIVLGSGKRLLSGQWMHRP
jgi:hypothetical protein